MPVPISNVADNTLENFLHDNVSSNSKIDLITSQVSIFAFYALRKEIKESKDMRILLMNQPEGIDDSKSYYDQYKDGEKNYLFNNTHEIKLRNKLTSSYVAKRILKELDSKLKFRDIKKNRIVPAIATLGNKDTYVLNMNDFDASEIGMRETDHNISTMVGFTSSEKSIIEGMLDSFVDTFESIWNSNDNEKQVTKLIREQIKKIYIDNTPEWLYYVSLYNIFHDQLNELDEDTVIKEGTGFKETKVWNTLYQFQKDGVVGLIEKLEKYNGAILADSVGLGKTYSALAVIKYYELRNDKVLVLAPKRLRENWTVYTRNDIRNNLSDDRFNYDVLNHTDLSRYGGTSGEIDLKTLNWGNYDLVVIDESHNFRNNNATKKDTPTRYQRLMHDVIKSGVNTKVLMLSATPVNNRMTDIKNQIAFITKDNSNALSKYGVADIDSELMKAQKIFNDWSELDESDRTTNHFLNMVNQGYFKILDLLTIARSRKHIEKYYGNKDIGEFPTRLLPITIKSPIDTESKFLKLDDVNEGIKELNLALYTPMTYVLPQNKSHYKDLYDTSVQGGKSNFTQEDRENALTGLIRVNLLKRMESSINSFQLTLQRIIGKIKDVLEKIEKSKSSDVPLQSINDFDEDEDFDSYFDDNQMIGNKVHILLGDMDLIKWKDALLDDLTRLTKIYDSAINVDENRDAKLNKLQSIIFDKIENPINDDNKKIVIFTAFSDTAKYLYDSLSDKILEKYGLYTALITGGSGQKTNLKGIKVSDMNDLLINFSPKSKGREKIDPDSNKDIDILIATDAISEGQNLQDCDYLINYDIHWNPVRVIQRFGRIDRIGSTNKKIQLVNFWPNMDLDEYINLENRVRGRMVLMNTTATGEDDVLNVKKNDQNEMNDLKYRRNQLKQLQNEVVDLEDVNGTISITDMTYSGFKADLSGVLKKYSKELANSPKAMFAVADSDELDDAEPGVIFVLKKGSSENEKDIKNSLDPYIVMYVKNDGSIKFNSLQSQQTLSYFKKLCLGQNHVLNKLVNDLKLETHDMRNMEQYTNLLKKAINSISNNKEKNEIESLFTPGGTMIDTNHIDDEQNNFEVVSFLIIKKGQDNG